MITDLLGDGISASAALALSCRSFHHLLNETIYKLDAESERPTAPAWGALAGNLECMERATEQGTPITQNTYHTFRPGQRQGVFLRELECYSLDICHPVEGTWYAFGDNFSTTTQVRALISLFALVISRSRSSPRVNYLQIPPKPCLSGFHHSVYAIHSTSICFTVDLSAW